MAAIDYVVTGRESRSPQRYLYPWNIVDLFVGVGAVLTLDLAADDEAVLVNAGILKTKDSTVQHTILR